jgi:hypothetical protein
MGAPIVIEVNDRRLVLTSVICVVLVTLAWTMRVLEMGQ